MKREMIKMGFSLESWFGDCLSGLETCVNEYFAGMESSCDSYMAGLEMARVEMAKGLKMVASEYVKGVKSINDDYLEAEKAISKGIEKLKEKRAAKKEDKTIDAEIKKLEGQVVNLKDYKNNKLKQIKDKKEKAEEKLKNRKENFSFLTLEFKKKETYRYNLIKLLIFLDKFQRAQMCVKACGPNRMGTAFIFIPIKTEAQVREAFSDIVDFAKRLNLKHPELDFKSVENIKNNFKED